ncbi:MAG: OadG family protein [Oscillospiraceae bacterium]|nr:OadG family protein [Oscillospiraceae bacterium]
MTLENLGIGDAAIIAVLGYAVVFFGLVLLMTVVIIMGKIFISLDQKKAQAPAAPAAAPAAAAKPLAPGAAGELKLHDVEPKTAAMLMAIVADKMGKPLNELRFKSITEVK